ncbi:hypothetical protein [Streptomyces sp. RKAG337]|uniref:hypothetical protein n=1 Tax=Streptomyces sp. RKAG337 TaxID=2893404 RepID=UPI00203479AF|nr:hypothetical protein [Streptomyces sp. RKAG337]MCM2431012.1 hypothetical protein [Streptomyces sp. RKAG337]
MGTIQQALRMSAPYWAAEHEIALRYFGSSARNTGSDKVWVGHQMFKEWTGSGVYGPRHTTVASMIAEVAEEVAPLGHGAVAPSPLRSTYTKLSFASDELRHYAQLHDLFLLIESSTPPPAIAELGKLREGSALTELRLGYRDDKLGAIAVDLSEGGGLGLYFGIRSAKNLLDPSDEVDREVLAVADRTIEDETRHLLGRFKAACDAGLDGNQWVRVSEILEEISRQKLLERNEQFGGMLTPQEVAAVITSENHARTASFLTGHLGFLLEYLGMSSVDL